MYNIYNYYHFRFFVFTLISHPHPKGEGEGAVAAPEAKKLRLDESVTACDHEAKILSKCQDCNHLLFFPY